MFATWFIAMISMMLTLAVNTKRAIHKHVILGGKRLGGEMLSAGQKRLEGYLHVIADTSILASTMRLVLVIIPWPFYSGVQTRARASIFTLSAMPLHQLQQMLLTS